MIAKVSTDTDRWKVHNRNTDNDHVSSYDDIKSFGACKHFIIIGRAVFILLIMEEEEDMVGIQFNSFGELETSA